MIQEDDSYVQTLMKLGPTFLQAKIYLILVKLGKADVKTIAKTSNVARSDVYRIMPTIEKLGLAEKIIAKATMYKATPMQEGVSILLQNRREEYAEIEKTAKSLLNSSYSTNLDFQEEHYQVKITSEITLLFKMLEKLRLSAQTSIDMTMPGKILRWKLHTNPSFFWQMKKDVKIRVITQKIGEKAPIKPQACAKNPFIEIKYSNGPLPCSMHIFDKKIVTLSMTKPGAGGLPALWSNNENVVKLAEAYFEKIWNSAETS